MASFGKVEIKIDTARLEEQCKVLATLLQDVSDALATMARCGADAAQHWSNLREELEKDGNN